MTRALLFLAVSPLLAQTPAPLRIVHAVGTASITIKPDQAKFNVGVVTQATTAQDAAAQNATQADAVTKKLVAVLTGRGSIKTVAYSIAPRYNYPQNRPAELIGYTATNTIEVTCTDLTIIGPLIDAANQAGANTISGLQFSLQNPEPVRLQALSAAGKQARSHADAIAGGIGGITGRVLSATEGATYTPIVRNDTMVTSASGAGATPTPVTTGTIEVTATVSIDVELQ